MAQISRPTIQTHYRTDSLAGSLFQVRKIAQAKAHASGTAYEAHKKACHYGEHDDNCAGCKELAAKIQSGK